MQLIITTIIFFINSLYWIVFSGCPKHHLRESFLCHIWLINFFLYRKLIGNFYFMIHRQFLVKFVFTRFRFDYFRIKIINQYKFHIRHSWIANIWRSLQTLSFNLSGKTLHLPQTLFWDNCRNSFKHVNPNPLRICR